MLVVWFVELLENLATRRLSGLVAATPAIGARFQAFNPRTVVVNNYPIFGELAPRYPVDWEKRAQAVAYVGCIALERGVVEMVRAMEYVPQELGATLELAGAFSPPGHREFVQDKSGWRHVREHGVVSRVEVARLLSRVRAGLVLFHPEPNHVQSQPNKLFEYMSAGIPVIASDFPLWREIVEQANCGLLVDPLNPRAIARAIEYVLTHPGEAEAMGRRGRETAAKHYTWDSESEKLIRLYNQLLSTRG
jgi:glycosyltransferase involved in cell wall biosynthesis